MKLPAKEFDLKDNVSRAARSTTRNIAEGFGRFHYQENIQFCRISRGSLFEIIDDTITMLEEKYISETEYIEGIRKIDSAIKILNGYTITSKNKKMHPTPAVNNLITQ